MSVIIKKLVKKCRECPFATNSAKEHDDPFTSSPINTNWWCTHKNGPREMGGNFTFIDEEVVHKKCPFLDY